MPLSHREKQRFFDSLARLVRSGITLPKALDKLSRSAEKSLRRVMEAMRGQLGEGRTVAEVFRSQDRELGIMESSVLGAAERTGRMDEVLHELADYHGALASAREKALTKLYYPIFVFHFGVLLLSVPKLVTQGEGSGLEAYLRTTLGTFAVVYLAVFILWQIVQLLRKLATRNAAIDRILNWIPVIGAVRRNFALSRFCLTYELQLSAGVNTFDALESASDASQSGLIRSAVARTIPEVREGSPVGEALAGKKALPSDLIEGLIVGEESGQLDQVLTRLAARYQDDAITALQVMAEWLPRIIYLAVLGYMAWMIIKTLMVYYFGPIQQLLDSM
ncbi:MAG: type II secretion system F family protein [Chthoniobacteraceae bacterium]